MLLKVNNIKYEINADSFVYNEHMSVFEVDHMDLCDFFSTKCIVELQNIANNKLNDISIDNETFKLIDFLDLNYLLFNYDMKRINDKDVNIQRIDEYFSIINFKHKFISYVLDTRTSLLFRRCPLACFKR